MIGMLQQTKKRWKEEVFWPLLWSVQRRREPYDLCSHVYSMNDKKSPVKILLGDLQVKGTKAIVSLTEEEEEEIPS